MNIHKEYKQPILYLNDIGLSYYNKQRNITPILHDINIELYPGHFYVLIGESGSGKTSLALSILNLLPQNTKISGSIIYNNIDILKCPQKEIRKIRGQEISLIFQDPNSNFHPLKSIRTHLVDVLKKNTLLTHQDIEKKIIELLELTGISKLYTRLDDLPCQLSGGQKQRLLIAMAIAHSPKILIADEAITDLDIIRQKQILNLLVDLQKKLSMTVIFITHNLLALQKIADEIMILSQGTIVEKNTASKIINNPQHSLTKHLVTSQKFIDTQKVHESLPLLEARDLTVHYETAQPIFSFAKTKRTKILHNLNFDLKKNKTTGLIGESGSGKTTLAMAILQLIPFEGQLIFNQYQLQNLSQKNLKKWRQKVQIVFQNPFNSLDPHFRVQDIIGEGIDLYYKISKTEKLQWIEQALEDVRLPLSYLTRYPHELSGGQRQRVAIARALILKPELLILDEPTSALDYKTQEQIMSLLDLLRIEHELSYLFISHDLSLVKSFCHDLIILKDGDIVESGSTKDVFLTPYHSYTQQLLKNSA